MPLWKPWLMRMPSGRTSARTVSSGETPVPAWSRQRSQKNTLGPAGRRTRAMNTASLGFSVGGIEMTMTSWSPDLIAPTTSSLLSVMPWTPTWGSAGGAALPASFHR
jgi:hypothetical protein